MLASPPSMRPSAPAADRVARIVAVVASTWYAFTAAWGMFGIPGGGHIGAGSAAITMDSEQIVRWKILYPAWGWYGSAPPPESAYVCHHPFGLEYTSAFFLWIFGHHDLVVHLPAALLSVTFPPLLYGIAKERWGAPAGAVAAAAYSVVPLAVGYSGAWTLEGNCIFGALLFFWGHSRHTTTGQSRYLAASLFGLFFACMGDWAGYLLVGPTLVWALFRAFVFPARWTPPFVFVRYARWWALSVAVVACTLVFTIGLFLHAGHVADWLSSGDMRSSGSQTKLADVLKARAHWIDFSFTPLAIFLGKIAAPIGLVRWIAIRRDEETYAPGLLFGAVIQYVAFKQGADIHIFWPHYFAPYFALALAQLADSVAFVAGSLARRSWRTGSAAVAAFAALAIGLSPVIAMAHDGVLSLWVWRRTGGRYDDNGTLIRSHVDMLSVLEQVAPPMALGDHFDFHPGAAWGWEHQWKTQSNAVVSSLPAVGGAGLETHPIWLARGSGLSGPEATKIASIAHVRIYGDTWIVDQREHASSVEAYSLNEREPNPVEWLLRNGTEPVRKVGPLPDPWLTWEWRKHLGQQADPPSGTPRTLDEIRIAHNVAVDLRDAPAAGRWRAAIEGQLDRSADAQFTGGMHLLGVRLVGGVQPRVEAWFECGQKPAGDAAFNVRSTMEARGTWSLIPPDPVDREMAYPPFVPTKLWRAGYLYRTEAVLNHRIGRERYWGYWATRDGTPAPVRADGAAETTVAILP